jgi:NAD+ kinase
MPGESRRALIVANLDKDDARGLACEMGARLGELGVSSSVFAFSGAPGLPPEISGFDLLISLGGDGTVLFSARAALSSGVPLLPFNLGRLGFIASFQRGEWRDVLDAWSDGKLALSERMMLEICLERPGRPLERYFALNDGVVSGQGIAKVIGLEISIAGTSLGTYRSDGVIVATPTGSTAYSLAAGGPVLHPEMPAMILNPICPFTLWNRPLVVPETERIEIEVKEGKRTLFMLTIDGQETSALAPGDRVSFVGASKRALIYAHQRQAFYDVLRDKLSWSGGPGA